QRQIPAQERRVLGRGLGVRAREREEARREAQHECAAPLHQGFSTFLARTRTTVCTSYSPALPAGSFLAMLESSRSTTSISVRVSFLTSNRKRSLRVYS